MHMVELAVGKFCLVLLLRMYINDPSHALNPEPWCLAEGGKRCLEKKKLGSRSIIQSDYACNF